MDAGGQGSRGQPGTARAEMTVKVRDAGWDCPHPGGIDLELVDDLGGDEPRMRVYPGAAVERPPDESRVGDRGVVAHLREVDRNEVVHGDDARRGRSRRHDEIGAVHDIYRPKEKIDRREVASAPGAAERTSRHGSTPDRDTGRDQSDELVLAPPGHRERGQVKGVTRRQGAQEAATEVADPGLVAVERFGVNRDTETDRGRGRTRSHAASVADAWTGARSRRQAVGCR